MANPAATKESRPQSGKMGKGERGTSRKDIPPPTGAFALPPPKPHYFEDGGLRKVKPYMFTFESWAKERWQGRTLLDIEFRDRTNEYYEWAIENGVIVVNNQKSTPDCIIRNGDLISNVLHRHEPPVVAGPIKILYDGRLSGNDGETLVVEKPGSMPVHPTGRYNFNTLLEILKYDYDLPLVHTSNRLDRLTSGVMVCALTVAASKKLGAWFGGRRNHEGGVSKEYVARCIGRFPDGEVVCEEPLLTIDRQIGVNVVHPDGRVRFLPQSAVLHGCFAHALGPGVQDSKTIFTRMSYDEKSNTSVVHCRPITGRSHQIRVHLQFLGHPIANDPIYQNTAAWGESGGKGGVFGTDRGGTAEDRAERRERGERVLALEKARLAETGTGTEAEAENGDGAARAPGQEPGTPTAPTGPNPAHAPAEPHAEIDRKSHDAALTVGAQRAILALREVKDTADGHARQRDLQGIERARRVGSTKMSLDAEEAEAGEGTGEEGEGEEQGGEEGNEGGEDGFCATCFTPLLPDPRPEQLFIWLHAMRYKTIEWDWSSSLPYWAEADYDVPLSSILS
ncbi:pseudouridine synthase [Rhodotorula diobovata]|uniref:Pseudouridine synthase n=1 Tax=Rhodotorula diobovata TaxID=5288 RepID=A0A5C5G3R7_9BASI|nr:pseudouridine synthase [Rhodotorula diobovata]